MTDRRAFVFSLAAALSAAPPLLAADRTNRPVKGEPHADLLPGKPPILDFGAGLRIPMGKAAFKTLWEGKDFWVTFGSGNADYAVLAINNATNAALGTMKLGLLTLAFAPDRLERVDGGGWRLKSHDAHDFVMGEVDLPGKPFMPVSDTNSSNGETTGGFTDPTGGMSYIHAFTGYYVQKKDVSIGYIRTHAQLL